MQPNNGLDKPSGSQGFTNSLTNGQSVLTSGQIAQFLTVVMQQGGGVGQDAQRLLTLLTQNPDAQTQQQLNQSLSQLASMAKPTTSQLENQFNQLVNRFAPQIVLAQQRESQGRVTDVFAGKQLAQALTSTMKQANIGEKQYRSLFDQLQRGDLGSQTMKKLTTLLQQTKPQSNNASTAALFSQLDKLISQRSAKSTPEEQELQGKLRQLIREGDSKKATNAEKENGVNNQQAENTGQRVTTRQHSGQQQQQQQAEQDDDQQDAENAGPTRIDNTATNTSSKAAAQAYHQPLNPGTRTELDHSLTVGQPRDPELAAAVANPLTHQANVPTSSGNVPSSAISPQSLIRSTAVFASVTEAQADQSLRQITGNNQMNIMAFGQLPMDALMLMSAKLGIEVFGNTAEMVIKSKEINTSTQKIIMDRKIEDYREQLIKAQEEADKAKKTGIFATIFSWIVPIIAVVAAVFAPFSIPLIIGAGVAIGIGLATAGLTTYKLVEYDLKGKQAPEWLQKTISGLGWAGMAVAGVGLISGGISLGMKLGMKLGLELAGKLGNTVGRLLNSTGQVVKGLMGQGMKWGMLLQDTAQGISGTGTGIIGVQRANLQKEIADIDIKMEWDQAQMDLYNIAQDTANKRMEMLFEQYADSVKGAVRTISELGSLQGRIVGSLI